MHFNPYHDPKNGQFSSGGSSGAKGPVVQKYLSSEKAKKEFLDILKKEGIINKMELGAAKRLMKSGQAILPTDSDLYVRDRIVGLGRVIKEDLNNHYYVTSVKLANGSVQNWALISRDGNKANIYAYGREGILYQNLSNRTVDKVKNALEK